MFGLKRRRGACGGGLTALALIALACGGGGEPTGSGGGGGGGTPPPPGVSVTVSMLTVGEYGQAANSFSPSTVTIARAGTVTWTNESAVLHNVTFASTGAPPSVPNMGAGSSSRTFPDAGTFSYQCTNHGGMSGSVTVAP